MIVVNEIFSSIQGESGFVGYPFLFIRLTGCNLRCSYCDTTYAYDKGRSMSVDQVVRRIMKQPIRRVLITGGEPLLQEETPVLADRLLQMGCTVLIETNGSLDIGCLHESVHRIMDLKCPSSGVEESNRWENLSLLSTLDEVKFVVADRVDYTWARNILFSQQLTERCPVLFSPVTESLPPAQLASWILEDALPVRLNLQIHKSIWPDTLRGV